MRILLVLSIIVLPMLGQAASRSELVGFVEKINKVKKAISVESSQWLAEKQSLELELQLFKDALKSGEKSSFELKGILLALRQKTQLLQTRSNSIKKELSAFGKSLGEQLKVLLAFAKSVPAPLKSLISKQIADAQLSLDEDDALQKLQSLNNLVLAMQSLQKSTHRVKEIVEINKQQREVEVLYIGTAIGYFLAQDKKTAGRILFKNGQWQVVLENELADRISLALKQMDRQGVPRLVDLPIGGEK